MNQYQRIISQNKHRTNFSLQCTKYRNLQAIQSRAPYPPILINTRAISAGASNPTARTGFNMMQMRQLSEYSRGRRRIGGKVVSQAERYKSLVLPKTFTFVCIPDNGEMGAPRLPKMGSAYFLSLSAHQMVHDITFNNGTNAYCIQQIQRVFEKLPLEIWRFYSVEGSRLTDATNVCPFTTFDLEKLAS